MKKVFYKLFFITILFLLPNLVNADVLKKVEISGNERISSETIIVYGEVQKNKNYNQEDIDNLIKKLYETKFFSKISVNFSEGTLKILVEENPIINTIILQGEPTKKFKDGLLELL